MPIETVGGYTDMTRLPHTLRQAVAFVVLATLCALALPLHLSSPAAADGLLRFRFDGGGWGHGTGMSQYGARGQADAGRTAPEILTYYYRGTTVAPMAMRPNIRVGIRQSVRTLTVRSAGAIAGDGHLEFRFTGGTARVNPGETWQVVSDPAGWRLLRNGQDAVPMFSGPLTLHYLDYGSLLKVDDTGNRYRWGSLDFVRKSDGSFDAAVDIPSYEQYLYGLAEVPSSWPVEALRAQAIAGRSYAMDKAIRLGDVRANCTCTVFSSVLDQAYSGYEKEAGADGNRWVQAVNDTADIGVLFGGQPITALYSSSSGGHTENNSFTFGGPQQPYLTGVPDPWDATPSNPNHRWSVTLLGGDVTNRLSARGFGVGTVLNITPVEPFGVSGRVGRVLDDGRGGVVVRGTEGTRRLDGSQLRSALGLRDTLFRVTRLNVGVPAHPNGTLMKSVSSPDVWLVRNGRRTRISSPSALATFGTWSEVVVVSDAVLGVIPIVGAGYRDGSLVRPPDGKVYLISRGLRRHIVDPNVFAGLGLSWGAVRNVGSNAAVTNLDGPPITDASRIPDGLFVKTSDSPALYLVVDGVARHVPTPAVLDSYRVTLGEVAVVSANLLSAARPGTLPPIGFRDGTLIRASDGRMFLVSNGLRRHILSPSVLTALGYAAVPPVGVSVGELGLHQEGPALTEAVHPDGAFVRAPGGPTIWLVSGGRRLPFVSGDEFSSRAAMHQVAMAAPEVLARTPVISSGWRDGTLIGVPGGPVYLVSNGLRRHITSGPLFDALGFSAGSVIWMSAADAAIHPLGAPITQDGIYDGMFVQVSGSPTIYRVAGGVARPVVSPAALESWRVAPHQIAMVRNDELGTTGSASGFRDGSLIAGPDGRVWVISDGARRWITAPDLFAAMGYESGDVRRVDDSVLAVHPEGASLE